MERKKIVKKYERNPKSGDSEWRTILYSPTLTLQQGCLLWALARHGRSTTIVLWIHISAKTSCQERTYSNLALSFQQSLLEGFLRH